MNESLGAGMYTSLMGIFALPAPIKFLGTTSVGKIVCTIVDRFPNNMNPWHLSKLMHAYNSQFFIAKRTLHLWARIKSKAYRIIHIIKFGLPLIRKENDAK